MTYLRCIPLCFGPGGGTPSLFYAQFPRNVRLDRPWQSAWDFSQNIDKISFRPFKEEQIHGKRKVIEKGNYHS